MMSGSRGSLTTRVKKPPSLRLSASNLAPRDYASSEVFSGASTTETTRNLAASYTNWQLRLELKL